MLSVNINNDHLAFAERVGAFDVFKGIEWPGLLVIGEAGADFDPDILIAMPPLRFGCVVLTLDDRFGKIETAKADFGSLDVSPVPPNHRLVFITKDPMTLTPHTLDTVCKILSGQKIEIDLPEEQRDGAREILFHLHNAGIGEMITFEI